MDLTSLSSRIPPPLHTRLLTAIRQLPARSRNFVRENPGTVKRIVKCAVTLAAALALTITKPLVQWHGTNPFLLGTTAIYLFPIRSVGGQIVFTIISLLGALLGLAYANLALVLANLAQPTPSADELAPLIPTSRRVVLFVAMLLAACLCGHTRSKHPRLYLSTVFFMIVNMFALIRGLASPVPVFRNYFPVIFFGAAVAMVVSLLLWPEDHSRVLRAGVKGALSEARQAILDVEKSIWSRGFGEVDVSGLAKEVGALGTAFTEADYEISLARVDGVELKPLRAWLEKLLELVRVYNCTVRARPGRLHQETDVHLMGSQASLEERKEAPPPTPACPTDMNKRRAISFAFLEAVRVMDMVADRIETAYTSKTGTSDSPMVEIAAFAANMAAVEAALSGERARRTDADILADGVEEAAFVDLLHEILGALLEAVKGAAEAGNAVSSTGRLRLFLPMKFRRAARKSKIEDAEKIRSSSRSGPADPESPHPGPDTPDLVSGDEFAVVQEDPDTDDTATTPLVHLRPQQTWCTRLALTLSRALARVKHSRHLKYAVKFSMVMGILSAPAFVGRNYIWYESLRVQWALISAMVAMETTRGMTFRTAGMKVCGAVGGGVCAFVTMQVSQGHVWANVLIAFVLGFVVGGLVNNATCVKAGTVAALAFNIIIGVSQSSADHNTTATLARRLLTLPVGLAVAMIIHMGVFPFHARAQLGRAISHSMDWLHHLLFAIELAGDPEADGGAYALGLTSVPSSSIVSEGRYADVVRKTQRRVRFAGSLMPATRYEISLAGRFPVERFQSILDRLSDIVLLIVGSPDPAGPRTPVLLGPGARGLIEAWGREQLLGSLCNDLLVLSHTLSARLYMPRHRSHSSVVLAEYMRAFRPEKHRDDDESDEAQQQQRVPSPESTANYADVGRLATLVREMDLLREEVDALIAQSHVSSRTKEVLPELVASVSASRVATAVASRCPSRAGWDGSTAGPSRAGSVFRGKEADLEKGMPAAEGREERR
ncbi:hypothetical protein BDZ91DRAFT_847173 [Kalaharituber pfeilii]|nr:hypothetical protein BDZ91DRAFT_847173 [Kalaharituber pfeilii]